MEDIVERAHAMVAEDDPAHYPDLGLTVEVIEFQLRTDIIDLLQLLKATGLCATGGKRNGRWRRSGSGSTGKWNFASAGNSGWGMSWSWMVNFAWTS